MELEANQSKNEELSLIKNIYVHKWNAKNIFISDVRRSFLTIIHKNIFEQILTALDEESRSFLRDYFYFLKLEGEFFLGSGEYYALKSILPVIEKKYFENALANCKIQDKTLPTAVYKLNARGDNYVLTRFLTEVEEKKILLFLDMRNRCVIHDAKVKLSNIIEQFDSVEKEEEFYAKMFVDPAHEYFFEHPNEHVPGMMALEALRQFGIACAHIFGHIPLEGNRFIIKSIHASFLSFIEFSYPITLKGKLKNKKLNKLGQWTIGDMDLQIIQKNEIVAEANIEAVVISERLFNKIRSNKYENLVQYRYYPILKHELEFAGKDTILSARLLNISIGGFLIEVDRKYEKQMKQGALAFKLVFNDSDIVTGKCAFIMEDKNRMAQNLLIARFKFLESTEADTHRLADCILKYCKVVETHEVF